MAHHHGWMRDIEDRQAFDLVRRCESDGPSHSRPQSCPASLNVWPAAIARTSAASSRQSVRTYMRGLIAYVVAALIRRDYVIARGRECGNLLPPAVPELRKSVQQDVERTVRRARLPTA